MKNKKGNKSQKLIAQIEKQVKSGGDPKNKKLEEQKLLEKKAKEDAKKKEEEEKRLLYQPISAQKVEQGLFPQSHFVINGAESFWLSFRMPNLSITYKRT